MKRPGLALLFLLLLAALVRAEELKIKVLEQGMGPAIEHGQIAVVDYTLSLSSGKVVDKSQVGSPFEFEVGSDTVIPGFSQGVEGMKVGERRDLEIPPELGYGSQAQGEIPANATLHFEVELLRIKGTGDIEAEMAADHDHDHGHEGEHGDLSQEFRDPEFLANRNARDITRPAMYEYLLRDFFTKPWRYEDGYIKIYHSTLKLIPVFLLLLGLARWGHKKGYLIP